MRATNGRSLHFGHAAVLFNEITNFGRNVFRCVRPLPLALGLPKGKALASAENSSTAYPHGLTVDKTSKI